MFVDTTHKQTCVQTTVAWHQNGDIECLCYMLMKHRYYNVPTTQDVTSSELLEIEIYPTICKSSIVMKVSMFEQLNLIRDGQL